MALPAEVILYTIVLYTTICHDCSHDWQAGPALHVNSSLTQQVQSRKRPLLSAEGCHTRWAVLPSENMSFWQFFSRAEKPSEDILYCNTAFLMNMKRLSSLPESKGYLYICIKRTWFFWPSLIEEEPYFTVFIIIFLGFLIMIFSWPEVPI